MTAGYGVEIDAAELRRSLREIDRHAPRALARAHKDVAQVVAAAGRRYAPKGPTGRLRANVRAGGTQTRAAVRAGGTKVPYAGPIHWGWPKRNIAPNEFLTRAVVDPDVSAEVAARYVDALSQALRRSGMPPSQVDRQLRWAAT